MERVKLTHAEVVKFPGSDEVKRIKKLDNGNTLINFNLKTRVNDRSDKAPFLFRSCTMFLESQKDIEDVDSYLIEGNILEIEGYTGRSKSNKTDKWYDNLQVKKILPVNATTNDEDGLPF